MEESVHITIIDREGVPHEVDAPLGIGMNMMELSRSMELPVEGTCGGMAMCASCQMYIESEHDLLERNDDEQAMLDEAWHVQDNSRLGCQIPISEQLEGLVVRIAPE
ncbi:MAG: 2Fe-2S iron-sulfur cluster binding domain-containing protein [Flavobacteriales bacterium]|nr:2Fe-2S iron-sulfur cluster binding domain-containing protein [Flavobacteriales bacterium]